MAAGPSARRLALRALLSLPPAVLRGLAGGGVTHVGGRTLDPRLQFLASRAERTASAAGSAAGLADGPTPLGLRAAVAEMVENLGGAAPPGVRIESLMVPGAEGDVPARAYRSGDQDPAAPLLVFAHFGGGVVGDLNTCEAFCALLAQGARCAVLSVGYRLAPEHRFPAGLEDYLAAARWGRDHAERFGAPAGRLAVGGDSIGGAFAAVAAQEMARAGEPPLALQLLIYPLLDVASESPSMSTYAKTWPLGRDTVDWFMGHYLRAEDSPGDPRISPLRAADLSGLAPAIIVGAGFDPLLDQGEACARRLQAAGVPVIYRCWDHLAHAFTAFTGVVPQAEQACRQTAVLVRRILETSPA